VIIDVGTLEDWFTERTMQPLNKRRRLNLTVEDIENDSEKSDDEMIELNHTVELDKSLLYEKWQEDFEKEKKLLNKKKRKRNSSSVRSKSRSPSPAKSDPL